MDELTCRNCGRTVRISLDENGWPMVDHATAFVRDHGRCLATAQG